MFSCHRPICIRLSHISLKLFTSSIRGRAVTYVDFTHLACESHCVLTGKWKTKPRKPAWFWGARQIEGSPQPLLFQFPVLHLYYIGLKTIFYLYTVIFRSYKGTIITFNIAWICFVLKTCLSHSEVFAECLPCVPSAPLHPPFILLCAPGAWPPRWASSPPDFCFASGPGRRSERGRGVGWGAESPASFPTRSPLVVCPSIEGHGSYQPALSADLPTSGSSIYYTPRFFRAGAETALFCGYRHCACP